MHASPSIRRMPIPGHRRLCFRWASSSCTLLWGARTLPSGVTKPCKVQHAARLKPGKNAPQKPYARRGNFGPSPEPEGVLRELPLLEAAGPKLRPVDQPATDTSRRWQACCVCTNSMRPTATAPNLHVPLLPAQQTHGHSNCHGSIMAHKPWADPSERVLKLD